MAVLVDMTVDEGNDISEVVDITDESEDDVTEVVRSAGGPPVSFGGYRRGRELGRGRSGQVFLCNRKGCPQGSFAVKTVDLQRLKLSADFERTQRHMRRELEILKRLPPHRHVVQLVAAFEEGSWLLLVLELVAGGDLFTALMARAQQRLFDREAAFVLRQLVCGLHFLHGQGIIHRDLKLENVLVASARRRKPLVLYSVKITDFGLSKAVGQGFSEARSAVGTRPYAAPEVLRGEPHGCSSDLWCLGILLYVLLAGRFPFESSVRLAEADIEAQLQGDGATSGPARPVLAGLLRLEPSLRLPLETLSRHSWLQGDDPTARPNKRSCEAALDAGGLPVVSSRAQARSRSARPIAAAGALSRTLQAEMPRVPFVDADVESAFKELMELVSEPPPFNTPDDLMEDRQEPVPMECAAHIPQLQHTDCEDAPMGTGSPHGTWTPFAVEGTIKIREVQRPSPLPDVMQLRVVIADRFAGPVLGKNGSRIQDVAFAAGCRVWMTSRREGDSDRHIVMIGNYRQCKVAQELVHEQLSIAQNADWQDIEVEVVLLVRAEAAGVITGKQGFVLGQIQDQSGARLLLLREEVEGQRPCIITGSLQNVLRAEKHIFDLVKAVPAAALSDPVAWASAAPSSKEAALTPRVVA